MIIGVIGTGTVGRTIAAKLADLGHDVVMGTRDVAETLSRTKSDSMGNPPLASWRKDHPAVSLKTLPETGDHGELLVNATLGSGSLKALHMVGASRMNGKVLMDIANPLDFSKGMPPTLFVKDTDSLAEQIQRTFPLVKVVKTLNTMNASLMVNPTKLADGDHTVFVCGNDAAAKASVAALLGSFGWKDILDLGDLTAARGTEMILPVWLRIWGTLQTPMFNFKIIR